MSDMYRHLERNLRAAHMPIAAKKYFRKTILITGLSFPLLIILAGLLIASGKELSLIPYLSAYVQYLIGIIIIPFGIFLSIYYYPALEAGGRKNKINIDLPYAITYMQALSSTITLYDIFRSVYEASDLYGEVSKECGLIVRDVELFGLDLINAIENMMKITPSENLRELLNDLLLVHRSGGDLRGFFNAKSESYRELARIEMDSLMQFLEMIAEVYVTAFVAGPIAIIIMLVAQNLSGQSTLGWSHAPSLYRSASRCNRTDCNIVHFVTPK